MAAGTGSLLGNAATFALSSGSVGLIVSIDPEEETIEAIPDDDLSITGNHQKKPGLLTMIGEMQLVCVFNPDSVPAKGTVVTGTLTYAPRTGQTNGAVRAGTGFVVKRKVQSIENDTRVLINIAFQFDGKTGPTYTAGT
jgi:hypothetical protein